VHDLLRPGELGAWPDVRERLNALLRGWAAYFEGPRTRQRQDDSRAKHAHGEMTEKQCTVLCVSAVQETCMQAKPDALRAHIDFAGGAGGRADCCRWPSL
jgi:hypothetical protein